MARSTKGGGATIGSESVEVLLPGAGSAVPGGGVTVAVFDSVPVAEAESVPVTMKVAVPPAGRLTSALMLPVPEDGHDPPDAALQVHVTFVSDEGIVSTTVAPVTPAGPRLVTTML